MDNKIRLWNTSAILQHPTKEPHLLSTLTSHNGAVMCARFSQGSGQYLASGADDMIVLVWERDTSVTEEGMAGNLEALGNSDGAPTEIWRPVRRLTGHESDVCDVTWAPGNRYLASCGLDNTVLVWDGRTFERVARLTAHTQFVKGLAFDPAGRFLATQSDDKTLRIWRTNDWQLQTTVERPFQESIFSTYFRRPSWAPDGAYVAAANAANGRVPVAALVARASWTTDLSLVGHHAAVEAVRFCPRAFRPQSDEEPTSICAVGAQDRSITVWLTSQAVPLVVAPNLFSANLLDLAWHIPANPPAGPDATVAWLAACSHDGTVALLEFERCELGTPVSNEQHNAMLAKYGGGTVDEDGDMTMRPQPIAETVTQLRLEDQQQQKEQTVLSADGALLETQHSASAASAPPTEMPSVQAMPTPVRTAGGRKRVAPLFVRPLGGMGNATPDRAPQATPSSAVGPRHTLEAPEWITAQVLGTRQPHDGTPGESSEGAPSVQWLGPQTLVHAQSISAARVHLSVPTIVARLACSGQGVTASLIAYNNSDTNASHASRLECSIPQNPNGSPALPLGSTARQHNYWTKYLGRPITALSGSNQLAAASLDDGTLHWFDAESGARLAPPLTTEAQTAHLSCRDSFCLLLDAVGQLWVWDTSVLSAIVEKVSIAPLLYSAELVAPEDGEDSRVKDAPNNHSLAAPCPRHSPETALTAVEIGKAGAPILSFSDGRVFVYHLGLRIWLRIGDTKSYRGSEFYVHATPFSSSSRLEQLQASAATINQNNSRGDTVLPQLLSVTERSSVTLDHLEHQLAAADALGDVEDVLRFADLLARRLAMTGNRLRVAHWLADLLGPPLIEGTCLSDAADSKSNIVSGWRPQLATEPKRLILRRVLPLLAANRHLQPLVTEYSDVLEALLSS
ncbi:HIR complex subunit [Coemansia sp. RSA 988]|nr:HIR complex subunit [Coemansia sp. RSA 988]